MMNSLFRNAGIMGCLSFASLSANPQNPETTHGQVSFDGLGSPSLTVESGDKAIINWESFSIDSNEVTRFIQSGVNSAVLNRVMGSEMSSLLGQLQGNGKVYLINSNGIVVGKDGVIDVGSFVASSFNISDADFLKDGDLFFQGDSVEPIVNEGMIKARNGDVLIIAHRVENKGTFSAKEGSAIFGVGHNVLVGVRGKNYLYVIPELPGDGMDNEGEIEALNAILEVHSSPFSLGLQNKGSIDALEVEQKGGEIYLSVKGTSGSEMINDGSLNSSGDIFIKTEGVEFQNKGYLTAKDEIHIESFVDQVGLSQQKAVSNYASMKAEIISINAPKFENDGSITAKKEISVFAPGAYLETQNGKLSTEGGSIKILAGNYFTSGSLSSKGDKGGEIEIEAENFISMAGKFDATGRKKGGKIKLTANSFDQSLYLNDHVVLDATGKKRGGMIELISPLPVLSSAEIKYEGKEKGHLNVPSSFGENEKVLGVVDPHPNGESSLWVAIASSSIENDYASSQWKIWDRNDPLKEHQAPNIELAACPPAGADLVDPNASGTTSSFGNTIVSLSSGNVVVTKPLDDFAAASAGAVYVFNQSTGGLVSTLRGSQGGDNVGSTGVTALTNGNFVVQSASWANGGASAAGAATIGDGSSGVSGAVAVANSLVGSESNDAISSGGAIALTNGNYVVASPGWNNGNTDRGAATWGSGVTGVLGAVSTSNSIYGTENSDAVSSTGVVALAFGNFVVSSAAWQNGGTARGAATWGDGASGTTGAVATTNSLYGTEDQDQISSTGVTALTNGNYLVLSEHWNNGNTDRGAATFGNGSTGTSGAVATTNTVWNRRYRCGQFRWSTCSSQWKLCGEQSGLE